MSDERTPWFDGKEKPARPGPYERRYVNGALRDTWDGTQWSYGGGPGRGRICVWQKRPWRGLASDPSSRSTK